MAPQEIPAPQLREKLATVPRGRGMDRSGRPLAPEDQPVRFVPTDEELMLPSSGHNVKLAALVVGATGVVFGDIGTSPLYAMKESLRHGGLGRDAAQIMGTTSLIFWSLTLVVTLKYLIFIMRADNHGEGGILALLALLPGTLRRSATGRASVPALLLLVGAGLLYGDGALTPAISVLSAVEGLTLLSPNLHTFVVPITCVILLVLFLLQAGGTHRLGQIFGPVMIAWFALIGGLGLVHTIGNPGVIKALLPTYAWHTLTGHGVHGFLLLGSVILSVTGAEALYADLGHFGAKPIRISWLGLIKPALVLAYLGQAATVLEDPETAESPLYAMAPNTAVTMILLVLATMATVIASQALITGLFSLTRQAIALGYFPRLTVRHTSQATEGQIFIPELNVMMAVACITLVLTFRSSERLAAAYGVAVAGTMAITSVAFYWVVTRTWGWPVWRARMLVALFLAVDLAFLTATLPKFMQGGYVPIIMATVVVIVMYTWQWGTNLLYSHVGAHLETWEGIASGIESGTIVRTPGSAVFLASNPIDVPQSLSSHVQLLHSIPETARIVSIVTQPVPVVVEPDRFILIDRGNDIEEVVIRAGYMETPHVPLLMDILAVRGDDDYTESGPLPYLSVLPDDAVYVGSFRSFAESRHSRFPRPFKRLYKFLYKNAISPTSYYNLPTERVVTLGTHVDL